MNTRRSTINDVADRAGVSIKTVSRVFNNEPNVRPTTRDKVLEAAKALAYRPNVSARRLAANRSFVISLLYEMPQSDYVGEFQEGSLRVCLEAGYNLLIHPCHADAPDLIDEVVNLHGQAKVDGFIVLQPVSENETLCQDLVGADIPFVRVSQRSFKGPPLISVDDQQAAARMTNHLIDYGHKRIGFIMGRPRHGSSHDRLAGYQSAIEAAGIVYDATLVQQGLYNFESGYSCARRLLSMAHPPTAIFASNDHMAMGVLTAAHEQGIEVPARLSVAGFDDTQMARFAWPPLTTIRQPVTQVARQSTEVLIKTLRGEDTTGYRTVLQSDLVRRSSTGPAPQ